MTASTPGDGEVDLDRILTELGQWPDLVALVAEVRKLREQRDEAIARATHVKSVVTAGLAVLEEVALRVDDFAYDELRTALDDPWCGEDGPVASRPVPRVITTREELDALPRGAVIRDAQYDVCEKDVTDRWLPTGERYLTPDLPATVLWCPPSPGEQG